MMNHHIYLPTMSYDDKREKIWKEARETSMNKYYRKGKVFSLSRVFRGLVRSFIVGKDGGS